MKLRLAPGKIAVKKIEAKLKSGLALPATRTKSFDIAEVTEVGGLASFGHEGKESTAEIYKTGDIILFQLPMHIANLTSHMVKGIVNLFLNAQDIVAKLDSSMIEMKSFHIAGHFVLLKPTIQRPNNLIIVPDNAKEMNKDFLSFSVLQKGADVNIDIGTGQQVFPNLGRINPLVVDNEEVCFIDQVFIDAVMAKDDQESVFPGLRS